MRSGWIRCRSSLLIVVALVLPVGGCDAAAVDNAATSSPSASTVSSSAPTPTATTAGPLTTQERAWLRAVAALHQRFDKEFRREGDVVITPSKLRTWERLMRSCRTELARVGAASARLRPVEKLVQQACREFEKGAACYAVARRYLNSYSTAAHKKVEDNLNCGSNAEGDGSNLLTEAEAKGRDIDAAAN